MSQWTWIEESVVWAVHEAQLAEHGGLAGVRDAGLLASALARPLNLASYGDADAAALAAAYAFGIARNHPFIDGNKRTAFVCAELFLALNGVALLAEDASCVSTMLALAGGELPETELAAWLRTHTTPL
ncbi:MAG: type II toxin-antitoxin system death-on-curing family toxin [Gammaproteobacteria bacterium]|nr:type II toxin-antitoxin system death-on-curing family toxin [Gammaproteobacteria bacterium]MBU1601326.1 type II toxin-antitoxin system death-on-curing family toxin [Gammaproteobacteria bacterium]MBU2433907.1 type II toxin-antitoxin system death-on-curing family toxin [Gammaproteobacteria bacterium]MBU2450575.1 type II toxin-antitoxin system death-on-curing family toxin [Gammaproteobacteria bacterium]